MTEKSKKRYIIKMMKLFIKNYKYVPCSIEKQEKYIKLRVRNTLNILDTIHIICYNTGYIEISNLSYDFYYKTINIYYLYRILKIVFSHKLHNRIILELNKILPYLITIHSDSDEGFNSIKNEIISSILANNKDISIYYPGEYANIHIANKYGDVEIFNIKFRHIHNLRWCLDIAAETNYLTNILNLIRWG